ncbi:hypothetical protein HAX54_016238 [Datura stramonium]|uniref:Carboxypeptidase A inhibitor-like domain-containing protein n=1 Tax=Datura stramonium TaxID=4076 RepID=A0ABS8UIQ1_DATST|nr:hypothetical protein [Datura stramonium]
MASFQKQLVVFMLLLLVATIGSQNMKVMAIREMPMDMVIIKQTIFPDSIITCQRSCQTNSDCSDGIICRTCHWFPDEKVSICLAA